MQKQLSIVDVCILSNKSIIQDSSYMYKQIARVDDNALLFYYVSIYHSIKFQAEHSYDAKEELAIIGKIMEYYKETDSYNSWKEYPPDDPLTQMVCASNRCLPNDAVENAQKDDTSILFDLEDILTCNM